MCEAISAARPGPLRAEPIRGFRLEEHVTDVVDQETLNEISKCKNRNILHLQHLFIEYVVFFPCINAFEIVYLAIPDRGDSCKRNTVKYGMVRGECDAYL